MSVMRRIADGLTNALSGMGGRSDPRSANRYCFIPLSQPEIEAAYRGSGLMRKCIDIPAFDMIREGRNWQAEKDQIEKLEAEEARLGLPAKLMLAEILRGLGGGAMIIGAPGDPALPISKTLATGALQYIHVVNRWQLSAHDWIDDPTDPLFGGPRAWEMTTTGGQRRIHPSRVVCFKGDPIPNLIGGSVEDQFWGESRVQRLLDAVQNSDTAQQAFTHLITKARSMIVGIPGLLDSVSTAEGEASFQRRMLAFQSAESMFNAIVRDAGDGTAGAGETIDHRQVNWAGIPEIMYALATFVAGLADIPVTRLIGKAAEGMNASGQSQQTDYNKHVRARQNLLLRPCLERLDAVLIPSAFGSVPEDVWWQFAPLDTPSEAEEATRFKSTMEAIEKVQNTGAIPDEAFAKGLQNTLVENGWMPGLEGALEEIPEAERYGINQEPDETDPSALVAGQPEQPLPKAANDCRFLADAAPKSLYIERKLLNVEEVIRWAKGQGIETTVNGADMHVTIAFSRSPVDWFGVGSDWSGDEDGKIRVRPGGPRAVERLGDGGAVALLFSDDHLEWRHKRVREAGASWDRSEYRPHVTITWNAPGVDVSKIKPYDGPLVFGPELFSEVKEDWAESITEVAA